MLVLLGVAAIWPELLSIGVRRFVWPLGAADWPRNVNIQPLSRDLVVAAGESVDVRMRLNRGWTDDLRAWVIWQENGQPPRRELMSPSGDRGYSQTNASVRGDLTYWVEAGDDSTAAYPGHVHIVQRPAVTHATARIQPPPYAAVVGSSVQSLQDGRAVALPGSEATVEIGVTKPIGRDGQGRALMQLRETGGETHSFVPMDGTLKQIGRAHV